MLFILNIELFQNICVSFNALIIPQNCQGGSILDRVFKWWHACFPNLTQRMISEKGGEKILLKKDRSRHGSPECMEREAFVELLLVQFQRETLYCVKKTMQDYDVPEDVVAEQRIQFAVVTRLESLGDSAELMDAVDREYLRKLVMGLDSCG